MLWLLIIGGALLILAWTVTATPSRARTEDVGIEAEPLSPTELAAVDPVEALRRYGTPADASALAEQGVDLDGLGYRPGDGD